MFYINKFNLATSNFKKKNVNKQSVAVVNFESIEESARLLAREVSHMLAFICNYKIYFKNSI